VSQKIAGNNFFAMTEPYIFTVLLNPFEKEK